jgi:hypothetical protein
VQENTLRPQIDSRLFRGNTVSYFDHVIGRMNMPARIRAPDFSRLPLLYWRVICGQVVGISSPTLLRTAEASSNRNGGG